MSKNKVCSNDVHAKIKTVREGAGGRYRKRTEARRAVTMSREFTADVS